MHRIWYLKKNKAVLHGVKPINKYLCYTNLCIATANKYLKRVNSSLNMFQLYNISAF